MKVIQIYLPVKVSEVIQFNGLTQPLLRYYERLVAIHLTPILYKELKRSGWEKFKATIKDILKHTLADLGYDRAIGIGIILALSVLASRNPSIRNLVDRIRTYLLRASVELDDIDKYFPINESISMDKRNELTEIVLSKDVKIQFISIPLTVKDIKEIFTAKNSNKETKIAKEKAFVALSSLELLDDFDIKPVIYTKECIVCSIDEYELYKNQIEGNYSSIVVDMVNSIVYASLIIASKQFKYSTKLEEIIKQPVQYELTIDKLASIMTSISRVK